MSSGRGIQEKTADDNNKEYVAYLELFNILSRRLPERVTLPDHVSLAKDQQLAVAVKASTPVVPFKDLRATVESSLLLTTKKTLEDTNDVFQQKSNESKADYAQRIKLAKERIERTQRDQVYLLDHLLFLVLKSMERPTHKLMAYPFPDLRSYSASYTELMKGSGNHWTGSHPKPIDAQTPAVAAATSAPKPASK